MFTITALPAFNDNYIWVCHNSHDAWVVDPGDARVVLDFLHRQALSLAGILVTHHHADHTGGVQALASQCRGPIVGPARERHPIPHLTQAVSEGHRFELLGVACRVLDVPGHTAGHIAYVAEPVEAAPVLLCGDTLFSAGCGRLFEGTAEELDSSLSKLAALPDDTQVCCAHEYTLSNLRFAQAVEPDNAAVQAHRAHCHMLRGRNLSTLPSSIGTEKRINPFLRAHLPVVRQAASAYAQHPLPHRADVIAALRQWKNNF